MRVRIALHEKALAFEVVEEDLKNFSDKLRNLHPEAKVPVLIHGERVIYESAIIAEYVDDLPSHQKKLMPEEAGLRAEVRLWTYWCNTQFKIDLDKFKYGKSRFAEEACVGAEENLKQHLKKMEEQLSKSRWLVGENFSLGEVNLFPFVRQLTRIQPTPSFLADFPLVCGWRDLIAERASVKQTLQK
jgi:glutathione S-transferase